MALVTQTYYQPTEGVSQQPDNRRYETQVEELFNGLCDPVRGLQKRPPSLFITNNGVSFENAHVVNRSDDEQYLVTFHDDIDRPIRVFDFDCNEYEVLYADGQEISAKQYFMQRNQSTQSPSQYLRAVSIADYTIINNPSVVTEMESVTTPELIPRSLLWCEGTRGYRNNWYVYFASGDTNTQLIAHFYNGKSFAGGVADVIQTLCWGHNPGEVSITATLAGSGVSYTYIDEALAVITRPSEDITINTVDGSGGSWLKYINNEVASISDLPWKAPDGYRVRIRGYEQGELSDFWLQYSVSKKNWIETVAPGLEYKINASTMPRALIRQADNTFLVKTVDWDERKTGDDDSNPVPSFIGQKISNIFFYRNRLGFIAGENVILSKASEFFNFWYDSAVDILATDPIDEAIPSTSVVTLKHAIPMETDLVLFSDDAEYLLRAEGSLTPTSVAIDFLSSYQHDDSITPLNVGNDVYFINKRGSYSSLYRYTTLTDSYYQKFGDDVSMHIPYYIPNSVRQMIGNTTENFMALLSDDPDYKNIVFVYKFIIGADRRFQQQAWCKWNFEAYERIEFITFLNNYLYVQLRSGDGAYEWHKVEMTGDTLDLDIEINSDLPRIYVDKKIGFQINDDNATYDPLTDKTTIDVSKVYGGVHVNGTYWLVTAYETEEVVVIPAEEISISTDVMDASIYIGDTILATAVVEPANTTDNVFVWSVSDDSVAGIISQGRHAFITAKALGTFTLKVEMPESGISDEITLTVLEQVIDRELVTVSVDADTSGGLNIVNHLLSIGYTSDDIQNKHFAIYVSIADGAHLSTQGTALYALNLSGLSSQSIFDIYNDGWIIGRGGSGGRTSEASDGTTDGSTPGGDGSPAIFINSGQSLTIVNNGKILGGGGGGGGVSFARIADDAVTVTQLQAAGGGGAASGLVGEISTVPATDGSVWVDAATGGIETGGTGGSVTYSEAVTVGEEETSVPVLQVTGGSGGDAGMSGGAGIISELVDGVLVETTVVSGGQPGAAIIKSENITLTVSGSGETGTITTII